MRELKQMLEERKAELENDERYTRKGVNIETNVVLALMQSGWFGEMKIIKAALKLIDELEAFRKRS